MPEGVSVDIFLEHIDWVHITRVETYKGVAFHTIIYFIKVCPQKRC
jgi:hypothetical protein